MTPQINRPMTRREWALLLALSLLWAGTFFFIGVIVVELPPLTTVLLRTGIASLVLLLVARVTAQRLPREPAAWRALVGMGLFNNAMPFCLIAWGQTHIASGLAAILNATTPMFTVIVAHAFTHDEKMTANRLIGVLVGLGGVAWMIGGDALRELGANVLAQLAVVVASVLYALATVYGRRLSRLGIAPLMATAMVTGCAALWLLPVVLVVDQPWRLGAPSLAIVAAVLGLAVLSTAIAYMIYYRLLATAGATNLQLVCFLIPVGAILLGALFLHERLAAKHFVGMAVIAIGLAAIDGRLLRLHRR